MQQREKILAGLLLGVLFLWQIRPTLYNMFVEPVSSRNSDIKLLKKSISASEDKEFELIQAKAKLNRAKFRSFPPNPLTAQRMYQSWLTDLTADVGFIDPKIVPENRSARSSTYVAIDVRVETKTKFDQLAQFLFLFYESGLLHKIHSLSITSPAHVGDPLLDIEFVAQGLSLPGAAARESLLPRFDLYSSVTSKSTEIKLQDFQSASWKAPFRLRIGTELLQVKSINGDALIVDRAIAGTKSSGYKEGTTVEILYDKGIDEKNLQFNEFEQLVATGPFAIPDPPRTYRPRLQLSGQGTVAPGEIFSARAEVRDWNPAFGSPEYLLVKSDVESAQFDSKTGEIKWQVSGDAEQKRYQFEVQVANTAGSFQDVESISVNVVQPNRTPVLTGLESETTYAGETWIYQVLANDSDPGQKLTYRLSGDVPEGALLDPESGLLIWQIPDTFNPGDVKLNIVVADSGSPSKETSGQLVVKVMDDVAAFTYLIATINQGEEQTAWLYNRLENQRSTIQIGDEFRVGNTKFNLEEINYGGIVVTSGKDRYLLKTGKNFRQKSELPGEDVKQVSELSNM